MTPLDKALQRVNRVFGCDGCNDAALRPIFLDFEGQELKEFCDKLQSMKLSHDKMKEELKRLRK